MGRWKELLVTNKVRQAGRRRKCYRCGPGKILKDEPVFEVKDGLSWKGYCLRCAKKIVSRAKEKLLEIESELNTDR